MLRPLRPAAPLALALCLAALSCRPVGSVRLAIEAPPPGSPVQVGQETAIRVAVSSRRPVQALELWAEDAVVDRYAAGGRQEFGAELHWQPAVPGEHVLRVVALDSGGQRLETAGIVLSARGAQAEAPPPLPTGTLGPTPTQAVPLETPTEAPTATPTSAPRVFALARAELRLRSGPGLDYPEVARLPAGVRLEVAGRSQDDAWLLLQAAPDLTAWAPRAEVALEGNLETVPVAQTPPTPTATATGTLPPSPTPTVTPTPSPSPTATPEPTETATPSPSPTLTPTPLLPTLPPVTATPTPTPTTEPATATPTPTPTETP